jgi:hypothetical protein
VGVGTLVFGAVFVVTVRTAASPPAVALSSITGQADRSAQSRSRPADGLTIFRFDTFGDEQLWTDQLQMHVVIESAVDPLTALAVGLKVDVDAIPPEVQMAIAAGRVDLSNPATTVALIRLNAVVGVVGKVERIKGRDRLTEVGITCALCHSTVDDSFMPGIGRRLDGWPNLDLDPGGSSHSRRRFLPLPGKSTIRGGQANTTRGSTSMGSVRRSSSRRHTGWPM